MGIITKYLKNSEDDEELYIQQLDDAIKNGSKDEIKYKLAYIHEVSNHVHLRIPKEHLNEILSNLKNFTKICIMTTSADEMEFKK